ncbi:MAG: DRTGG domain-containing protein [Flavobacteriales bacterium]
MLNSKLVLSEEKDLNKIVIKYIVGSIKLSNYPNRLDEGGLIITSGDWANLIYTTLLASIYSTYPRNIDISFLTGGIHA